MPLRLEVECAPFRQKEKRIRGFLGTLGKDACSVTADNHNEPWQRGFRDGAKVGSSCPYSQGSEEAAAWESGWLTGIAERERKCFWGEPSAWDRVIAVLNRKSGN